MKTRFQKELQAKGKDKKTLQSQEQPKDKERVQTARHR